MVLSIRSMSYKYFLPMAIRYLKANIQHQQTFTPYTTNINLPIRSVWTSRSEPKAPTCGPSSKENIPAVIKQRFSLLPPVARTNIPIRLFSNLSTPQEEKDQVCQKCLQELNELKVKQDNIMEYLKRREQQRQRIREEENDEGIVIGLVLILGSLTMLGITFM